MENKKLHLMRNLLYNVVPYEIPHLSEADMMEEMMERIEKERGKDKKLGLLTNWKIVQESSNYNCNTFGQWLNNSFPFLYNTKNRKGIHDG